MKRSLLNAAILGTLGLGAVFPVFAAPAQITLCAEEYDIPAQTMGNPAKIRMWGYAIGKEGACGTKFTPVTSPGPSISLRPDITSLEITLVNNLPRPTSLVIPGLYKAMEPQYFIPKTNTIGGAAVCDGQSDCRLYSFDKTVAPGASATYIWNVDGTNMSENTFMYQSGAHQQVQVQMGLYGAIMKGIPDPQGEKVEGQPVRDVFPIEYSEIDPVIHSEVALGESANVLGVPMNPLDDTSTKYTTVDMVSTIGYAPKFFGMTLDSNFNRGQAEDTYFYAQDRLSTFEGDSITLDIANASQPTFALLNGSSRIHTPTLIGANFDIFAEDGRRYPYPRTEYAVTLPPGKTKDALLNTTGCGTAGCTIRLTDSAMNLSNPAPDGEVSGVQGQSSGELRANGEDTVHAEINVNSKPGYSAAIFSEGSSPIARRDEVNVDEGGIVSINVLSNDEENGAQPILVNPPDHGTLAELRDANGALTGWDYSHDNKENTRDSFIYKLVKANDSWEPMAVVAIKVNSQNDAPVARDDNVSLKVGQQMEVRVLDNDKDVDNFKDLKVVAVDSTALANYGLVSFVDKAVTITGEYETKDPVNLVYTVDDGKGGRDTANILVTITKGKSSGNGSYTSGEGDNSGQNDISGVPPVANDDTYFVMRGGKYSTLADKIKGVMGNDIENGGKVEMDVYPTHGSILMNADGTFEYEHDGSKAKEDHFSYTIYNQWGTQTADVAISVTQKTYAPRVRDDHARVESGKSEVIDVLKNDKDRDSDINMATIQITVPPTKGTVTVGEDNKLTYTPNDGEKGRDDFEYRLLDAETGEASSHDAKVKIRIK